MYSFEECNSISRTYDSE